jgi:hypothetical protein
MTRTGRRWELTAAAKQLDLIAEGKLEADVDDVDAVDEE